MSKHWTKPETDIAKQLLEAGADEATFRDRLGRSKEGAISRLDRIKYYGTAARKPSCTPTTDRVSVSHQAYADAAHRLSAPRSITATLMGDPAPGHSQLDRQRAAGATPQ